MTLDPEKKLTGHDYAFAPIKEVVLHPDYSTHAANVILKVMSMTTKELEELNVSGDKK